MVKLFDIQLMIPAELMTPLLQLVSEDKRVTIVHVGQHENGAAPPTTSRADGRDTANEPWIKKLAVPVMAKIREMAKDGANASHGVYYRDIGDILYKAGVLGAPGSISQVLSQLHRAGKLRKVSRGRYLPV